MNKGKLIKEGRNWKIQAPTFKQPMSIQGDFGLTDEMANQEVEFDNSKGPITKIRFNNKDFSRREIKNNQIKRDGAQVGLENNIIYGLTPIGKAHAPYNFIPINKIIVKSQFNHNIESIKFNVFDSSLFNGYIKLKIVSKTPLFIRGNRSIESSSKQNINFFSGKKISIPGSSLRGLLRTLIEIASYSKMSSVNESTQRKRFHYRAFADRSLTLSNAYNKKMLGQGETPKCYFPKVEAGVIKKNGRNYILCSGKHYKVEEELAQSNGIISQLMSTNINNQYRPNKNYKEEYKSIYFLADTEKTHTNHSKPLKYSKVSAISNINLAGYKKGFIVCTGWMIGQRSTRGKHMHWVIGDIDDVNPINIDTDTIDNYINDSNRKGMDLIKKLQNKSVTEIPCFYIRDTNGTIVSFGATGMFRLAYDKTLIEFFPEDHCQTMEPDFASVLFGDKNFVPSRLFVEDCYLKEEKLSKKIIIPATLGSPKPTTFQHYLQQNEEEILSVSENNKFSGFTGIKDYNQMAVINGYKLFWHKKNIENPDEVLVKRHSFDEFIRVNNKTQLFNNLEYYRNSYKIRISSLNEEQLQILAEFNLSQSDSQNTAIIPVLENATFEGKVRFENLTKEELGALLFVLDLDEDLCLKIGMGKPLGYGSVKITPEVFVLDREKRYSEFLCDWQNDQMPMIKKEVDNYKAAFEKFILHSINSSHKNLWDEQRMKELLVMLNFKNSLEGEKSNYMQINKLDRQGTVTNEFAMRPILPPPSEYIKTN
jgi:CRISPR-associated protein (TIGR03986 family)